MLHSFLIKVQTELEIRTVIRLHCAHNPCFALLCALLWTVGTSHGSTSNHRQALTAERCPLGLVALPNFTTVRSQRIRVEIQLLNNRCSMPMYMFVMDLSNLF
jgi:hypothetical protein